MSKHKPKKKKLVLRTHVEREGDEKEEDAKAEDETEHEDEHAEETDEEEEEAEEEAAEETEEQPPTTTKPPVKEHKGKKPVMEEWEKQLLDHLQFIRDYHEVTVVQFANFSELGTDARRVLDSYVAQELVERGWRQATGRYTLTEAGEKRRLELGGAPVSTPMSATAAPTNSVKTAVEDFEEP